MDYNPRDITYYLPNLQPEEEKHIQLKIQGNFARQCKRAGAKKHFRSFAHKFLNKKKSSK